MQINSVLVVDDNEADRFYMERMFQMETESCQFFEAFDGQDALDFISDFEGKKDQYKENFPPSVIFLDINMPRLDGFEFLDAFTKLKDGDARYNAIVIMMYTSSDNEKDMKRAEEFACVKGYIVKPITAEDIEKLKKRLLS